MAEAITIMAVSELMNSLTGTEEAGEIVSASATYVVTGVLPDAETSLMEMALTAGDLPVAGDALNSDNPNVKVVSRELSNVSRRGDDGTYTVHVGVTWELQRKEPRPVRGGVSINQVRTMNYPNGEPIQVNYPEFSSVDGEPIGDEVYQRGEVELMVPQKNIVLPVTKATSHPDELADTYVAHTNKTQWRDMPARAWLCTRADYQLVNSKDSDGTNTVDVYDFEFEFELSGDKEDLWDSTVTFKTKDGSIPPDLKTTHIGTAYPPGGPSVGKGMITFSYLTPVDFQVDFPDGVTYPEPTTPAP